jgi:hypothetical protein
VHPDKLHTTDQAFTSPEWFVRAENRDVVPTLCKVLCEVACVCFCTANPGRKKAVDEADFQLGMQGFPKNKPLLCVVKARLRAKRKGLLILQWMKTVDLFRVMLSNKP